MSEQSEYVLERENWFSFKESAEIFQNALVLILSEQSPFSQAHFVQEFRDLYIKDESQFKYFESEKGAVIDAAIMIVDGTAKPILNLSYGEGPLNSYLKKKVAVRLGIAESNLTHKDLYFFSIAHELGHLIQAIADELLIEDYDVSEMDPFERYVLEKMIKSYNEAVKTNPDIQSAQEYFRSVFGDDVFRGRDVPKSIDREAGYTVHDYLDYVNSSSEANADFIAAWVVGMSDPNLETSPQNMGYGIREWKRWAEDHKITLSNAS